MTNALTIGVCGFSGTGSSAVIHYLKEFDDVAVFSQLEFTIAHIPDGIQDLRYHLFEGSIKHTSSCLALERFKRLTTGYPTRMLDKCTNGNLEAFASDFLDSITQCEWIGSGTPDSFYSPNRSRFTRLLRKSGLAEYYSCIETKAGRNLALYPFNKKRYSCKPAVFDESARLFIARILTEMGRKPNQTVVLDQPFAGNNPQASFPYFENPKAIVVDRDPRDYYLMSKKFYYPFGWRIVPCHNVEEFVVYYKTMREDMPYLFDDPRILRIRFEDLIYEYDRTTTSIREFCNLESHTHSQKCFDPSKSIHNTNLSPLFPEHTAEIEYIEKHLASYLYPFEDYSDIEVGGERQFFSTNGTTLDGHSKKHKSNR